MKSKLSNTLKLLFILLTILPALPVLSHRENNKHTFPESNKFKGFLTDTDGVVFPDAEYDFIFSDLYRRESQNTIWSEVHKNVVVHNGEFTSPFGERMRS
ncbi:MAG: hypothetical protein U5K00_12325 [Melioribacteraceae bacterium]|nr:hypothetical protein [Melioribacteraceae bacterium]